VTLCQMARSLYRSFGDNLESSADDSKGRPRPWTPTLVPLILRQFGFQVGRGRLESFRVAVAAAAGEWTPTLVPLVRGQPRNIVGGRCFPAAWTSAGERTQHRTDSSASPNVGREPFTSQLVIAREYPVWKEPRISRSRGSVSLTCQSRSTAARHTTRRFPSWLCAWARSSPPPSTGWPQRPEPRLRHGCVPSSLISQHPRPI